MFAYISLDLMLLAIPAAQFYGGLIEDIFWILLGVWLLYGWPNRVHRQIARGKLTEEAGEAKLRKFSPQWGYAAIFFGISQTYVTLGQIGFFGRFDVVAGILVLALGLAMLVFWLWRRRGLTKRSS